MSNVKTFSSPFVELEESLQALDAEGRRRRLKTFVPRSATRAELDGREITLFAANDYLGLAWHTQVVAAFEETAKTHGVGSGASRLITGTSDLHTELERRIAKFKRTEAAIVFSSGFLANWGTITALARKDDFIAIDKLNHASIIDAVRASGARVRVFPHKNYERLEELLKLGAGYRRRLIVTDSLFSMDGDTANLKELVRLKNLYGAWLMLDEAHGTGVFGARGAGLAEAEGVEDDIDIRMGTLSKACGTMGGFVAGSETLIDYLRNHARSFIYSTALPPAVMAASIVAIDIVERDLGLRKKLWENVRFLGNAMVGAAPRGRPENSGPARGLAPTHVSGTSPIIPIIIGDDQRTMEMSEALLKEGFYVPGIRPPTVARGEARLRLTVSAAHSEEELRGLVGAFERMQE